MAEIYVPNYMSFHNDNTFLGSYQGLRFKLTPDVGSMEILAEYWYGPLCYESSIMDGSKTCIIDGKTFYILRNAEDWDSFIANIVSAGGTSEVNAIMAADISTVFLLVTAAA